MLNKKLEIFENNFTVMPFFEHGIQAGSVDVYVSQGFKTIIKRTNYDYFKKETDRQTEGILGRKEEYEAFQRTTTKHTNSTSQDKNQSSS